MTNSKATKKALFMSMLSLLLCFTMLMGATFAWFTDTVKSSGNRIQAGNLKVDLVMDKPDADGNYDGNYEIISNGTTGDIFSDATGGQGFNWEPGKTEIVYLGVQNNGSLAIKYNIILNVIDQGLIGSLEYAIIDGATAEAVKKAGGNSWKAIKTAATSPVELVPAGQTLAAENGVLDLIATRPYDEKNKGETDYFALAVHMKEEATNEYQNKGVKIDITVVATQVEAEEDSFDNTYDAEADFETASVEDLKAAIDEGGTIKLVNDMIIADGETLEIPAGTEVVIDLNGKTITGSNAKDAGAVITNNGNLKIVGGTVSSTATNGDAVISNSGTLTLEDVTITGAPIGDGGYPEYTVVSTGDMTIEDGTSITSDRGTLRLKGTGETIINGGSFTNEDIGTRTLTSHVVVVDDEHKLTINDGTFMHLHTTTSGGVVVNNWTANTVVVNGGNFSGGNYFGKWDNLSDYGYGKTTKPFSVKGGTFTGIDTNYVATGYAATRDNGIWTVSAKIPANDAELSEVINAGVSEITLAKNTNYTMPSYSSTANITIKGDETSVVDVTMGAYLDSATVSFEGVTIKTSTGYANGNGSDYAALYTPNVTYTDCTFVGPMRVGRDGAKFINCTFTELGNDYVWTYGNDVTFEGCTFNSDGKAVLIYSDGGREVSEVKVTGCKFNATAGAKAGAIANQDCAAIEIQNYGNGVNLTTSGNTVDSDFSGEWRIKAYHSGNPKVIVNGTEYTQIAIDGKLMTIDTDKNVTIIN